jgi:uncharacterized protein (DUF1501 family)
MSSQEHRPLSRREWVKLTAAGVVGAGVSGWFDLLAGRAAEQTARGARHKACILLWMDGGPSHLDTFDPKPDASAQVRGEFRAIATSVPGIQVCEQFPRLAGLMQHAAILRGMSTEEADHGRARVYMHSGYKPGVGGVTYPTLGAIVSAELGHEDAPLPNFVVTGTPLNKYEFVGEPGYRGPRHQPLALPDPAKGLPDLKPIVAEDDFRARVGVLEQLEQGFNRTYRSPATEAHRTTLGRAVQLMRSGQGKAFDLAQESEQARAAYGENPFGRGCLLARRLVEAGVSFVEVYLASWDGHFKREADQAKSLMPLLDAGMAALLRDLQERGLLESTLVVWMGEFGRTPRINRDGGRDHYARAWTTLLAGGGVRGGQVIGKTDREGATVEDRPVSVRDFMASVCHVLGIDPARKLETPDGRPVQIVDKGGSPIRELVDG